MDSPILMTLSKFQLVMHILGREQTTYSTSLMTQNMLHEVHASLCWCSLPQSVFTQADLASTTLSSPPIVMALTHAPC